MVAASASLQLSTSIPYVCRSCLKRQLLRGPVVRPLGQRRTITQGWLRKTDEAEQAWRAQAEEITAGRKESMLSVLEKRGYVHAIAGKRDDLDSLMTNKRVGAYLGIDPTAPSLHVGHLVPLMTLFWLHVHGFHTVSLLGGATAKVGDPTGRTTSRQVQPSAIQKANMVTMHYQLKKLWANMEKHACSKHGYKWEWAWRRELVNNNAWMNKLAIMDVLKILGSGVRIGTMLGRHTVRDKGKSGDGMSFAEFSYPILQAWDWWHMYQTKGIQLQIGGSDQFGNIIAGIDAIKTIVRTHPDPTFRQEQIDPLMKPMGFTVPLLTTESQQKFGKTAGNAVWLDKDLTSTFDLYQFFLRCTDANVGRYLRLFTFIPLEEINELLSHHEHEPSKRAAQRRLAREVVELIHGSEEANSVESQHRLLFSSPDTQQIPEQALTQQESKTTDIKSHLSPATQEIPEQALTRQKSKNTDINPSLNRYAKHTTSTNAPPANMILPKSLVFNQPIARVLHSAGLVSSRSEGHRLASARGAYIGSKAGGGGSMGDGVSYAPAMNWNPAETEKYVLDGDLLILRVGKWKVKVVKIVSDEEFEKLDVSVPGWKEEKVGEVPDETTGAEKKR